MSTPWLFTQNSTPRSACPHEQIMLANDEGPILSCRSCGKRWTFVPAGEIPRYCADDDPTYPGMLDNHDWSKSTRVAMVDDHDFAAATERGHADYEAGRFTRFESAAAMNAEFARLPPAPTDRNPTSLCVTITGPRDSGTTIARAILELLQEADVPCSMPEEAENPYDGDSIEQLGNLRRRLGSGTGLRVIVQTGVAP